MTGGNALMAYSVTYWPVEQTGMGVGTAHLPVLELLGGIYETINQCVANIGTFEYIRRF